MVPKRTPHNILFRKVLIFIALLLINSTHDWHRYNLFYSIFTIRKASSDNVMAMYVDLYMSECVAHYLPEHRR